MVTWYFFATYIVTVKVVHRRAHIWDCWQYEMLSHPTEQWIESRGGEIVWTSFRCQVKESCECWNGKSDLTMTTYLFMIRVMLRLRWDLCRDQSLKILVRWQVVSANMRTLAGATNHTNCSQVISYWIYGPSSKVFIGPLVCCLRSSNGISQREAFLQPWCSHRVSFAQSFLDLQISRYLGTKTILWTKGSYSQQSNKC
jgi:hypothetical protein